MRPIIILMLACPAVQGWAQDPFVLNDTTFIIRDTTGPYHAVFIAAQGDTAWYNEVAGPVSDLSEDKLVMSQRKALQDMGRKSPGVASTEYFKRRDWVKAVLWKGRPYLYRPSDPNSHFRAQQFPRLIITDDGVDPIAYVVVAYPVKSAEGTPTVDYASVSVMSHALDPVNDTVHVRLHTVDAALGLTLWEFEDSSGDVVHELMVPRENARLFPIIVNYPPEQKEPEFEFDVVGREILKR